jgi:hypothetical protein
MGKYNIDPELDYDVQAKFFIANELAERNRLKRLEISLNQGLITSKRQLEKDLEDQA